MPILHFSILDKHHQLLVQGIQLTKYPDQNHYDFYSKLMDKILLINDIIFSPAYRGFLNPIFLKELELSVIKNEPEKLLTFFNTLGNDGIIINPVKLNNIRYTIKCKLENYYYNEGKITYKKLNEFRPWLDSMTELSLRYWIILYYIPQETLDHLKFLNDQAKSDDMLQDLDERSKIMTGIQNNAKICDILIDHLFNFNVIDIKLDVSFSAMQLISTLIGDNELMMFAGVRTRNDNSLSGYDEILALLKETLYESEDIQNIIRCLNNPNISVLFLNELFSRNTIKRVAMVYGYHGTLYGSEEKLYDSMVDFFKYNCISKPSYSFYRLLRKVTKNIAGTIRKIMETRYKGIQNYMDICDALVEHLSPQRKKYDGIIIPQIHLTYKIQPRKIKKIQHKINIRSNNYNLDRHSRKNLGIYEPYIDTKTLKSSLPANIIHGIDSAILFMYKETIRLFFFKEPKIQMSDIYDCFIHRSCDLSPNTIKDFYRLATYLVIKKKPLQQIINANDYDKTTVPIETDKKNEKGKIVKQSIIAKSHLDELFKKYNIQENIFDNIKTRPFEAIYDNDLCRNILANYDKWYYKNEINLVFFERLISKYPFNAQEDKDFSAFLESNKYSSKKKNTKLLVEWLMQRVLYAYRNFCDEMLMSKEGNLLSELKLILNNDDFMKM